MKRILRAIGIVILGFIIYSFGNGIGGFIGNLLAIFGGVMAIFGVVEVFRKKKSKELKTPTPTQV